VFKRLVLAGIVAGGLAGPALAADMAVPPTPYAPVVVPTPYYDWSGFYIGGNAGGAWVYNSGTVITDTVVGGVTANNVRNSEWGFAGGGQIGYNYFFVPNFILGFEADFDALTNRMPINTSDGSSLIYRSQFVTTARGRFGLTADRLLFYATGGLAYAGDRITRSQITGTVNGAVPGTVETVNHNSLGYAVGAGLEYALLSHVTAKVEFLYIGLGDERYTFPIAGRQVTASYDTIGLVRAGLNYKFGGGDPVGPVVTRY
jgi:outer membrane immunogenic protein